MSSLRFEGVAFAYSDAIPLFHQVTATLERGFTGIVGANGAGKSTLLRLIAGELAPTRGTVTRPPLVVTCPQTIDVCPVSARQLAARDDADAGRWRSRLALDPDQLARWATLSPGERRRWQLGGALAAEPDALLLDEPTNHVDRECRALLAGALHRFSGIGVIVSHDRALLDELATATLRVHAGTATLYPGNYTAARGLWLAGEQRARDLRDEARGVAKRATQKLTAMQHEQAHAEANRRVSKHKKNHKDHDSSAMGATVVGGWAEARWGRAVEVARRELDRAEAEIPDGPQRKELGRSIFVGFERAPRRWLFELAAPVIRAGDHPVLHDVRVAVGNADRIRIAGPNGAGKTTLLAALLATGPRDHVLVLPQELEPDAGPRLVGELRAARPEVRGRTLQLVAALGADPDRVLASAAPSPGEARKLQLALGLASHASAVVLDEPTNHFDLPSIERLEDALAAYPGALVLVSHDDRFAERLTTRTWRLERGKVGVE